MNQGSRKPDRLRRNDTVAVLSPSKGLPSRFPQVYELGIRNLEENVQGLGTALLSRVSLEETAGRALRGKPTLRAPTSSQDPDLDGPFYNPCAKFNESLRG
ncbi:MAG: hypothetical protein ABSE39_03195 [Candidatus Bathyarchaeia archaeon]|jgi:hypothetical protein